MAATDRAATDRAAGAIIADLLGRCTFPDPEMVRTEAVGSKAVGSKATLAAVSGGADSLSLLVLARAAGLEVTAVHVDHGLRPGSAAEADVVSAAAHRFGAGFRAESVAVEPGPDLEQRARLARRAVLGSDAMTGHTADDQAETVLLNLLRGAGPAGLGAMTPGPVHPLLALRRRETEALCRALDLTPVADPSNLDRRFRRNRVRHELLPLMADIAERDPVPLLNRTAGVAREMEADIQALAGRVDPTDTSALAELPPSVAGAALRRWLTDDRGHPPSRAELARVMAVVRHEAVACELTGRRRVARRGGMLRIEQR